MGLRIATYVSIGLLALLSGCGGGGGGGGGGGPNGGGGPVSPQNPPPPAVDTSPDEFSFVEQSAAELGSTVTSDVIVITGINTSVPISIDGGEYSIAGGAFTSAAGTVSDNQSVRVQVTASEAFSTSVSAVLTVGDLSATFTVTTRAADTTPDAFEFPMSIGAMRDAWVVSNTVTITGVEIPVPISVENGEYSIDGGAFTAAEGTISEGQSLALRTRASSTYSKLAQARVTVGTVSAEFEVISEVPDYIPDRVVYDGEDIVYLLSNAHRLVFRWSLEDERYLDAYVVGSASAAPTAMAHSSAHGRLYLSYGSGAIHYIDVTSDEEGELPFASTPEGVWSLASVGNYVLAQDGDDIWTTHYVFDAAGVVTDQKEMVFYSSEHAWDAETSRVYFFRDMVGPNDLLYEVIDQATGQITEAGETPYHGDYDVQVPIRLSSAGQYILVGSGNIFNRTGLTWAGALGAPIADARWSADGALVTLSTTGAETTLRHLSPSLVDMEEVTYAGQALRVIGRDASMTVLTIDNGTVAFHRYIPSNDSDGDGVLNSEDAFPLDPAASMDSDGDGYPDAWNAGRSQADSTTGLGLDAFPDAAECYLASHGSGGVCDYSATLPNYVPDLIVDDGETIYLLSSVNRRVYRWSITAETYLKPYVVGVSQGFSTLAPTTMVYSSAHERLYLGYSTGAIQYIDVTASSATETPFANTGEHVRGLGAAGSYVLASGAWTTQYVFDSNGGVTDQESWYYVSAEYTWDPVTSRVYHLRDGISPNDLHYQVVDQATGQITSTGETIYHGAYDIRHPIRVSVDGQFILLGSGDIYSQPDLTWSGSLASQIVDARWFADDSLVTISTGSNQTALRRLGTNLASVEQLTYTGEALRIVGSDALMVVLVNDNGTVRFHRYVPSDDSDGDGVANTVDAFPLDPAASLDMDRDGYPDDWNAGRDESDSTSGLTRDAYPNDSACYLPEHGDGVSCDYGATIPAYIPDRVLNDGDTVYLLSSANRRVYRWSIATGEYLNPYVVGIDQGFDTIAPTTMEYSSAHGRLYLGYSSGAIRFIDVTTASGAEVPYANTAMAVGGLAAAGNYVLAQDGSGAWSTHYIFDVNGVLTDHEDWNYSSREYAWDPVTSRVYFFRDQSPSDLLYEEIDQDTGEIASVGETPYHGVYSWRAPIRVSLDGQRIVLGGGDVFHQADLTWSGSLGKVIEDAQWVDDILVTVDETGLLEIRDANTYAVLRNYAYAGEPVRLVFGPTDAYLVQVVSGATEFERLPFYDEDSDSLPRWWEEVYGLDDSNGADAAGDPDSDGVSNADEYQYGSNPTLADSDADGLTDFEEIVNFSTDPARADSDGDGLSDAEEVLSYFSNPLANDTDGDGFLDLDEVLYGGDLIDPLVVPEPVLSYSESFEGIPSLAAWSHPDGSHTAWTIDPGTAYTGSASFKAGTIGNSERSIARFRAFFPAGELSFYAKVDDGACCDRLSLYIDGVQVLWTFGAVDWTRLSAPIEAGSHDIEWRYEKNSYGAQVTDAAWIDDVTFVAH